MMASGGGSSPNVVCEVFPSTVFARTTGIRPVGTWRTAVQRWFRSGNGLLGPVEVSSVHLERQHQDRDLAGRRNGGLLAPAPANKLDGEWRPG